MKMLMRFFILNSSFLILKIMLEIKDLHASINGKEILKGIDLTIRDGDFIIPLFVAIHKL